MVEDAKIKIDELVELIEKMKLPDDITDDLINEAEDLLEHINSAVEEEFDCCPECEDDED